jgi:hypothetical protein
MEVKEYEDLPEPINPFSFLTPDELNYFKMCKSHFGGASGGAGSGDGNKTDGDYEEEDDEATE